MELDLGSHKERRYVEVDPIVKADIIRIDSICRKNNIFINYDSTFILFDISTSRKEYFRNLKFYPEVSGIVLEDLHREAVRGGLYFIIAKDIEIPIITAQNFKLLTSFYDPKGGNFTYQSYNAGKTFEWEELSTSYRKSFGFCYDTSGSEIFQYLDSEGFSTY